MLLKKIIFIKELFFPSYVLNFKITSGHEKFIQSLEKFFLSKNISLEKINPKTYHFYSRISDISRKFNFLRISCQIDMKANDLIEISVRFLIGWGNNLVGYFMFGMVLIGLVIQGFELMKLTLFLTIWLIITNLYYLGMIKFNYKNLESFFRSMANG